MFGRPTTHSTRRLRSGQHRVRRALCARVVCGFLHVTMLLGMLVRVSLLVGAYALCEYVSGHYVPLRPVSLAAAKALPALYLFVSAITQNKDSVMAYYPKVFGMGLLFCAFGDAP